MNGAIGRSIAVSQAPLDRDLGLLILRLWMGLPLLLKHGMEKITGYSTMAAHFPDPLHIGSYPSFLLALFAEVVCSALVIVGLATRIAALLIVIDLAVAFALFHRFALLGPRNGEVAFLYVGLALVLVIAGGGRFSIDRILK
jgi:putative oxidoreductase